MHDPMLNHDARGIPAAFAGADDRATFIAKTYLHLAAAIVAFVALTGALIQTEFGVRLALSMSRSWLLVLGAFIVVGWIARSWADSSTSIGTQYAGLALYVVAESFIFLPLLVIARYYRPDAILPAAGLTVVTFVALSAVVFVTRRNFSFLGPVLCVGGMIALGLIVLAVIYGFSLGLVFAGAMVAIAAASILYDTSKILHEYPVGSHVAASLALFASIALMFWYILRIFMSRD